MKNVTENKQSNALISQDEQYQKDSKAFDVLLKTIGKETITLRDNIQKAAFLALKLYVNSNRTNQSAVQKLMTATNNHIKMVRAESIGYWFKEVGGLAVTFNKDTNSFTVRQNKEDSKHGVKFSYDNLHLRAATNEKLYFYEIAPVEYKELKIPESLEKAFAGAIGNAAKMQALGMVDDQAILNFLNGLVDKIHEKRADKATKEWIAKFQEQNQEKVEGITEIIETLPEAA